MDKKTTRLVENESQKRKEIKDLTELAELELQKEEEQKQINLIKKAIKQTLEAIKAKEKDRDKLNKEIKTLKQDIDNIRAGRLDLIAERQEKDEEAKRTSIIEVVKEKEVHHHHYDRWYEPYRITWKPYWNEVYCGSTTTDISGSYTTFTSGSLTATTDDMGCVIVETISMAVNCSIAKDAYAGTYQLDSGDCVTLT